MPFRVPLDMPVSGLAAGEKQKLEILKLLYLDQRFLILDEPTSVLTPGEADEILGLLRDMAQRGEITVAMISHKFREVEAFCDDFTVLGAALGSAAARSAPSRPREMAAMMIGDAVVRPSAARTVAPKSGTTLEIAGLFAENDEGRDAVSGFDLKVAGRRDRRHRRGVRQRPERAGRGAVRPAADQARADPRPRPGLRADRATISTSSRCSACRRSR